MTEDNQQPAALKRAWVGFERLAAAIELEHHMTAEFHAFNLLHDTAAAGQMGLWLGAANVYAALRHVQKTDPAQLAVAVRQLAMRSLDGAHLRDSLK